MTSSASSPVRQALEAYVAGRATPERVVAAIADAFYQGPGGGRREALRPLIAVIERAAPGVVELAGRPDRPGFAVRLAGRPFPKQYEAQLRRAAEEVLATAWEQAAREPAVERARPGLWARVFGAIERLLGRR